MLSDSDSSDGETASTPRVDVRVEQFIANMNNPNTMQADWQKVLDAINRTVQQRAAEGKTSQTPTQPAPVVTPPVTPLKQLKDKLVQGLPLKEKMDSEGFMSPRNPLKRPKTEHTNKQIETNNRFEPLQTVSNMETEQTPENTENKTSIEAALPSGSSNQAKNTTKKRITPIIATDTSKWPQLRETIAKHNIQTTQNKLIRAGIRITPATETDYHKLHRILQENKTEFYTFKLNHVKPLKVVLRGVPIEFTTDDVKADLAANGIQTQNITRMTGKYSRPVPLVLVSLNREYKTILNLTECCGIHITVEPMKKRSRIIQCHKCQRFGHIQENCYTSYICMKCGEGHSTHICTKSKETPAKCANCAGNHTAAWIDCPRNPNRKQNRPTYVEAPIPTHNPWTQHRQQTADQTYTNTQTYTRPNLNTPSNQNNNEELALTLGKMLITLHNTNATHNQIADFIKQTAKIVELFNNKNNEN